MDIKQAQRAVGQWYARQLVNRLHKARPRAYKPVLGKDGKRHGGLTEAVVRKWFKPDPDDPKLFIG